MFKALQLCPEAEVVRGRMDVYVEVSRQVRAMMDALTPVVEPLSLDEAFLDLSGTERLHGFPPAVMLARLQKRPSGVDRTCATHLSKIVTMRLEAGDVDGAARMYENPAIREVVHAGIGELAWLRQHTEALVKAGRLEEGLNPQRQAIHPL